MDTDPKDPPEAENTDDTLTGLLRRLDNTKLYGLTVEDEVLFSAQYLQWLCHGEFNHILEEDWERMLRQKRQKPAEKCRHGKNPLHCNVCYFDTK